MSSLPENAIKRIQQLLEGHYSFEYIQSIIRRSYNRGLESFEQQHSTRVNLVPNDDAIRFLAQYAFDNLKDVTEETSKKLRRELIAGLLQREGTNQLRTRVQRVMKSSSARASMIARTETHRAYGQGSYFAARQSGLVLKKYVYNPSPESKICQALVEQPPIPLNKNFSYAGESWATQPFHPNCRSRVLYVQEDAA